MVNLTTSIFNHNCHILWNFSDENLHVESHYKITRISKWELINRAVKSIDFKGNQTKKIEDAVLETLKIIEEEINTQGTDLIYTSNPEDSQGYLYPAYFLADRIKKHICFKDNALSVAVADKIISQRNKYPDSKNPIEGLDPKILSPREKTRLY